MKNFVVHDLVDGWSGQAGTLADAISMRDDMLASSDHDEFVIRADVDEEDL